MAELRAVFFDVDDTLIDYDRTSRAAFHLALGDDADFDSWVAMSDPHFQRYEHGEVSFQEMREQRMAHFLELSGRAGEDAAEVEASRFERLWSDYVLFDDVRPCLDRLRADGLILGLITNNEPEHQRHKLTLVGLIDTFDVTIISGAVGVAKPNPAIFALACEQAGVTASAAMHVGDRLDFDAQAATAAGLTGVWLDRRGLATGGEDVPVLADLASLPELIAHGSDTRSAR
jgi:putative hydrolase of the HAD superfamily